MTNQNPRNYPNTMASSESGRPMARGEKQVAFKIDGQPFSYMQPGWWCSLTDPDDMDGQLVDEDNQVAEMARRSAKAIARGERLFVPVVIRALRQRLGLTQREGRAGIRRGARSRSRSTKPAKSSRPNPPSACCGWRWSDPNCSASRPAPVPCPRSMMPPWPIGRWKPSPPMASMAACSQGRSTRPAHDRVRNPGAARVGRLELNHVGPWVRTVRAMVRDRPWWRRLAG